MERGPCGTARKPVPSKFETKTEFFVSNGLKRMIFFCQNFSYTISACVSYGFLVFEADYIMKIMKIGLARPRLWIVLDFLFVYDIFLRWCCQFFFWIFCVNVRQITSISENVAHDDRLISWRTEPVERVMVNVHVGIWMKRCVSRILEGKHPFETPSQSYQFHGHAHLAHLNFWWLGDKHWNANGNCTHAHKCTQAFCWQHDIKYQRIVSYGNREPGNSKHFLRIQYYPSDRKANEEKSIQLNILGAIN